MPSIRVRIAALIKRDNKILLIEHCKNDRTYWLLPGGGLEFGESIKECLEREMREETNLQVEIGNLAFTSETIDPNGKRHVLHMVFWASINGGELRVGQEERLRSVKFAELSELPTLEIHPPIGAFLQEFAQMDKPTARHLGRLWRD